MLEEKIASVVSSERASFHTPGHKGRPQAFGKSEDFAFELKTDVTELPGLDDLSSPDGVLLDLEERLALLFGAGESYISVNGASACLMAALMAAASLGRRILVPANLHRSAVSGLTLANLEPVWYKPDWNSNFGFYEQVSPDTIEQALSENEVAALLVVSPTYQGAMSDIYTIASLCKKKGVLLIVDEAHGAHLLFDEVLPFSALDLGADIVVHSLHKTLPALTQTGVLHVSKTSKVSPGHIRSLLMMLQSSSPSYQLMVSIEHLVGFMETDEGTAALNRGTEFADKVRVAVESRGKYEVYEPANGEPWHVLIRPRFEIDFQSELRKHGIGIEAMFNQAALFLIGAGNNYEDLQLLTKALKEIAEHAACDDSAVQIFDAPPPFKQAMAPAEVLFMPSHVVPVEEALGRVSAECIAPCPPGTPVVVPGQLIEKENLAYMLQFTGIRSLRVAQKL